MEWQQQLFAKLFTVFIQDLGNKLRFVEYGDLSNDETKRQERASCAK